MTFRQAFENSSYLLLLSGFLALASAGALEVQTILLYLLFFLLSWRRRFTLSSGGSRLMAMVLLLGGFTADALFLSGFVSATIHLLMVLSLVKLFTRGNGRDYLVLYLISFAFLLVASTFTISLTYPLVLLAYLFFSILTFVLFESRKAYEENQNAEFSLSGYLGVSLVTTGLIVLFAVPIFLAIPRTPLRLFADRAPEGARVSGFSDRVRLGEIGRILNNSSVVMRVKVDREPEQVPLDLKWRGVALDHYDGRVWRNTRPPVQRYGPAELSLGVQTASQREGKPLLGQSFVVEPFTRFLFGAPRVVFLKTSNLKDQAVVRDGNQSFSLPRPLNEPTRYTVYSQLPDRRQQIRQAQETAALPRGLERYTRLDRVHPRIFELAEEIAGERVSPVGKALAIEQYLRQGFQYSLENLPGHYRDPLYHFLFVSRAGHCEYFATAQAVMMRTLGIPSRVVNGFRRGEYNRWGGYFVVRQSDAHSWVEGFFPGAGWVEFDPTPPRRQSTFALGEYIGQLRDALDVFWAEVVTFDRVKQIGFFQLLATRVSESWQGWMAAIPRLDPSSWVSWRRVSENLEKHRTTGVLFLGLLALVLVLLHRRRSLRLLLRRRLLKAPGAVLVPEYYREMLEILARRGFVREGHETPAEFVGRIQGDLRTDLPLRITELYYRSRFGDLTPNNREIDEIWSGIQALRQ